MNPTERAMAAFEEGFSCSQSVFAAFAPEFGTDPEWALKVSGPFGGGMGRLGEVCGAVTGAFMAIGLRHGRVRADDLETKERAYALVQEFTDRFIERHGTVLCRELLGADIGTPEGKAQIEASGISEVVCPAAVRDAAEILEDLLAAHSTGGRM
jgi:C_GCAxxG_C_C family probable redox protein